ncbi:hypothetical protein YPPY54_2290, partial [Yersinia pestis PY-54]
GGSILGRWWRYKWITFHPSLTQSTGSLQSLRGDNLLRHKAFQAHSL